MFTSRKNTSLITILMNVFASVDLHWQQGKGNPSPEHLPSPSARQIHPS